MKKSKSFAKITGASLMIFALIFGCWLNFAPRNENFANAVDKICVADGFILNKDAADTEIVDYRIANPAATATTRYHATENLKSEIVNLTDGVAELSVENSYEGSSGKVPGISAGSFVFGADDWTDGDFITIRYNDFAKYNGENLDLVATYSDPTIFPARPTYHTPSIEIQKRFYAGFWFTESGEWKISYKIVKADTETPLANPQKIAALVGSISPASKYGNGEYTAPLGGISDTVVFRGDLVAQGTTTTTGISAYMGTAAQVEVGENTNVSDDMRSELFLNRSVQYNLLSASFSLITGTQNTWSDHTLATTNMWSTIYLAPAGDLLLECPAESETPPAKIPKNSDVDLPLVPNTSFAKL